MADPKKNPLIGSFRTPVPGESPPGTAKEQKPPEQPKVAGAAPGKADEKKPPEQTKTAGAAAPGKADEKKPPEQTKAAGAAAPGKADEKKLPEQAKAAGAAASGKADEKKPPEQIKAAGVAAPGKADEKKPPEQTKAADAAAPGKADEKSAEPTKDPNLRYVKISDIQPLPGTYVKDAPRADYSDLIDSIKKSGLEKPVILRQAEKGGYQLVDGFHRCEALKQAGVSEIRADVYDMTIFDASRYRKEHRANPDLSIPGTLVPLYPDTPSVEGRGSEAPETEDPPLEDVKIPLTPVGQPETVTELKITNIRSFEGHPFNVKDDEDMKSLVDSVRQFGVLEPVMVIPHKDGGYEMVSGHRRMRACQLVGIESIPVIIRNLDRDEAIISMVDSNLKREKISPMEKARAYQMKTDAMRRKVGRRSNAEILNGEAKPLNADQELAKQVGESVATIQRFKTLNKLTPELQEMVDQGKIPVNTGADIAQMKPAEQNILADAIKREDKVPTGAKAKELKEASKAGTLTEDKINQTVAPTKRELEPELKVTFSNEELRSYFPDKSTTVGEVKRVVFESLTMRQKALERRAREAAEKGKAPPPAKTSPSKTR